MLPQQPLTFGQGDLQQTYLFIAAEHSSGAVVDQQQQQRPGALTTSYTTDYSINNDGSSSSAPWYSMQQQPPASLVERGGGAPVSGTTPYHHSNHGGSPVPPPMHVDDDGAMTEKEIDQFPSAQEFDMIVDGYLNNLSLKKRDKALVDRPRYALIARVLKDPKNTAVSTAQFRFWVKKMFQLVPCADGSEIICHDSKPVAMREDMYDILVRAHAIANHGGRDKTSSLVRRRYSWIPKELVARFVRQCPFCIARRNGCSSPPITLLPRTPPDHTAGASARDGNTDSTPYAPFDLRPLFSDDDGFGTEDWSAATATTNITAQHQDAPCYQQYTTSPSSYLPSPSIEPAASSPPNTAAPVSPNDISSSSSSSSTPNVMFPTAAADGSGEKYCDAYRHYPALLSPPCDLSPCDLAPCDLSTCDLSTCDLSPALHSRATQQAVDPYVSSMCYTPGLHSNAGSRALPMAAPLGDTCGGDIGFFPGTAQYQVPFAYATPKVPGSAYAIEQSSVSQPYPVNTVNTSPSPSSSLSSSSSSSYSVPPSPALPPAATIPGTVYVPQQQHPPMALHEYSF